MNPDEFPIDFSERPYIVIWEVTQACDLACVHCRASAQSRRNPLELSTEEGKRLIDEIAQMQVPVFVPTSGGVQGNDGVVLRQNVHSPVDYDGVEEVVVIVAGLVSPGDSQPRHV
jgi:hypothetical protein